MTAGRAGTAERGAQRTAPGGRAHGATALAQAAMLVGLIVLCLGGGAASGMAFPIGEWYARLAKPAWTPPPWLFGPAWTLLYLLMAVACWRVWRTKPGARRTTALAAFAAQLALNFAWTPLFFGMQDPGIALCEIALLDVAIAATIAAFARVERAAAVLLMPYAGWTAFATALNLAIWLLN